MKGDGKAMRLVSHSNKQSLVIIHPNNKLRTPTPQNKIIASTLWTLGDADYGNFSYRRDCMRLYNSFYTIHLRPAAVNQNNLGHGPLVMT